MTVYETVAREVPIYQELVGQVYGFEDIGISACVEGYLEGIHFEEGFPVEKGILLYTLESQQLEADVAAKMSGVAAAETIKTEAQTYLNRIKPLVREKAVSQSDLDSAVDQYEVEGHGCQTYTFDKSRSETILLICFAVLCQLCRPDTYAFCKIRRASLGAITRR